MTDGVAARGCIAREFRSQARDLHLIGAAANVAAKHEGMQHGKFAHHLRQQVAQLLAIPNASDHFHVLVAHRGPIDAMHV